MDYCFVLGNDCAVAIAEHISGSIEGFADMMNEKAKELGLVNTNFVTPHGLDSDKHYTTAYDLAILTNYALNNETFKNIVGTKTITIMVGNYPKQITNTNELLGNIEGVYGVKTGFTGDAGRCLVTACKRNNLDIITVVLGADTKKIRGIDTRNIINYVYSNFEMIDTYEIISDAMSNFKESRNIKSSKSLDIPKIELAKKSNYTYPVNKNDVNKLKTSIYAVNSIDTDTEKGSKIGVLKLKCNEEILYSIDIILSNNLNRMTWKDYMKIFLKNYKKYFDLNV